MSALSVADLQLVNDEPRIHDLCLAEKLEFDRDRNIRKLIQRNMDELRLHGDLICSTVEQIKISSEKNPKGAGRPGVSYYLNEGQALLLCMFSRTPKAAEVRRLLIEVFMAWRNGEVPPAPLYPRVILPGSPDFSNAVRLVREARLSRGTAAALAIWRAIGLPWVEELDAAPLVLHNQEDVVARFHTEGIEQASGVVTPAATLWKVFCEWCLHNQLVNPGRGVFQTRFGRMGFARRMIGGRIFYIGIRPGDWRTGKQQADI